MKATLKIDERLITIDLHAPIDISLTLRGSEENPVAWYLDTPKIEPVQLGDWKGSVAEGASVNFNNIYFNPHAHATHTESVGHITKEAHSIARLLDRYFFLAEVITVVPETVGDDQIIPAIEIKKMLNGSTPEALIIRTLPNTDEKQQKKYSHSNWPYLHEDAAAYMRNLGIQHLLIDLPSVDKEKDEGALAAHKAFWNVPEAPRYNATITELIYVPNEVADGRYVLNLQHANFENDAAPSRPVLYAIE
ncbi:cyclase family protein [Altibacter sp. HG106]|uniref:cyclase family protein n=1 Tax=Altibacter sp. HG106 TaxID=3023937 RepID=UPI00235036D4|nr:cyclase family protein [Altibacter sp. HG106]MDC7994073.1 cyclase family protein [Altibacter sp. HG106]